jgi:hypothetical protein
MYGNPKLMIHQCTHIDGTSYFTNLKQEFFFTTIFLIINVMCLQILHSCRSNDLWWILICEKLATHQQFIKTTFVTNLFFVVAHNLLHVNKDQSL